MDKAKIVIYSTTTCVWCRAVEKFMQVKGVPYEKVLLDDKPDVRQKLLEQTGAMTVPITTNGKDFVVGYDVGRLAQLI